MSPRSTWPLSIPPAAVAGCHSRPTSRPAAGCSGERYLKGTASTQPILGQPVVPRAPEATQTLVHSPQSMPSLVNPTIYPRLPRLGTEQAWWCVRVPPSPETSITREEISLGNFHSLVASSYLFQCEQVFHP